MAVFVMFPFIDDLNVFRSSNPGLMKSFKMNKLIAFILQVYQSRHGR